MAHSEGYIAHPYENTDFDSLRNVWQRRRNVFLLITQKDQAASEA